MWLSRPAELKVGDPAREVMGPIPAGWPPTRSCRDSRSELEAGGGWGTGHMCTTIEIVHIHNHTKYQELEYRLASIKYPQNDFRDNGAFRFFVSFKIPPAVTKGVSLLFFILPGRAG